MGSFVPIIPNLQRTSVGGKWVKTLNGTLNWQADVLAAQSLRRAVTGWNPTQPSDLPFPWPASYVAKGQPFSVYTFAMNMIGLAALIPVEGYSSLIEEFVAYLIF